MQGTCGGTPAEVEHHRHHYKKCLFAEATNGSAEDYLLGIKEFENDGRVSFAAYDTWEVSGTRLSIRAFFADKDTVIGAQGIKYPDDVFGSLSGKQGFDYESEIVKATDHEGMGHSEIGVVGRIMDALAEKVTL